MCIKSLVATVILAFAVAGCGDSSTPSAATGPSATTQERIKEDLRTTGHDIKNAGDEVARKVDPTLEKAKEEAKEAMHRAAEKVAEETAPTQRATQP